VRLSAHQFSGKMVEIVNLTGFRGEPGRLAGRFVRTDRWLFRDGG
jgi:hypothetical protein